METSTPNSSRQKKHSGFHLSKSCPIPSTRLLTCHHTRTCAGRSNKPLPLLYSKSDSKSMELASLKLSSPRATYHQVRAMPMAVLAFKQHLQPLQILSQNTWLGLGLLCRLAAHGRIRQLMSDAHLRSWMMPPSPLASTRSQPQSSNNPQMTPMEIVTSPSVVSLTSEMSSEATTSSAYSAPPSPTKIRPAPVGPMSRGTKRKALNTRMGKHSHGKERRKARTIRTDQIFVRLERITIFPGDDELTFIWDRSCGTWIEELGGEYESKLSPVFEDLRCLIKAQIRPSADGLPIEVCWDLEEQCFRGQDLLGEHTLSISLHQMKAMCEDPLGRQHFAGTISSLCPQLVGFGDMGRHMRETRLQVQPIDE